MRDKCIVLELAYIEGDFGLYATGYEGHEVAWEAMTWKSIRLWTDQEILSIARGAARGMSASWLTCPVLVGEIVEHCDEESRLENSLYIE